MTLKCPKCGKELFVEDSGYLSECPFCHHPVQYGTAPKEEPPIGEAVRHPSKAKVKKPFWPSKEELFWGAGVVTLGLAVLIPRCNWLHREEKLLFLLLIGVPIWAGILIWSIKSLVEQIKTRASCFPKTKMKDTNEQSDDPFERWVKDFYYFKVFITQHLVAYLWSFIIGLSVLGVIIFKWPEVQVRIFIALLVILVSRVLLEFVVVLFGIVGLLRDIKEELCQRRDEKKDVAK